MKDIRRVLDDKSVDAVSVATPNHWHALMTIWACQAGKDVYVEKPCSHNVHEGRIAVEAARQYNRIVQHGTQSRSEPRMGAGRRGDPVGQARQAAGFAGLCYKPRNSIGFKPTHDAARGGRFRHLARPGAQAAVSREPGPLQLALVLGFRQRRHRQPGRPPDGHRPLADPRPAHGHGKCDLSQDRPQPGRPVRLSRPGPDGQHPDLRHGLRRHPAHLRGPRPEDRRAFTVQKVGNIAHLEAGHPRRTASSIPRGENKPVPLSRSSRSKSQRGPGKGHFGNFIAAVRSRKVEDLNADILEGHYSAALCHLANISYRLGEEVPFSKSTRAFGDDKEAYETLDRMEEHLKDNGVALDGLNYRLGRKLTFDAATESFVGDPEANQLLTRPYRAPFVVPDRMA